jgi:hypothetical protein
VLIIWGRPTKFNPVNPVNPVKRESLILHLPTPILYVKLDKPSNIGKDMRWSLLGSGGKGE